MIAAVKDSGHFLLVYLKLYNWAVASKSFIGFLVFTKTYKRAVEFTTNLIFKVLLYEMVFLTDLQNGKTSASDSAISKNHG